MKESRKITDLTDICYVGQKYLTGLNDIILNVKRHISKDSFAVLLGDTWSEPHCTTELLDIFNKYKKPVISVIEVLTDKICNNRIIMG